MDRRPRAGPTVLLPAAAARVSDVVAAIPGGRWDAPSPCSRWTVRDVLNHLTSEHLWAPHLLRGELLQDVGDRYDGDVLGADPPAAWTAAIASSLLAWADADPELPGEAASGDNGDQRGRNTSDDAHNDARNGARNGAGIGSEAEAFVGAAAEAEVHTSMGRIPVREYAHQMLVDLTVHGWDLATGAGLPYEPHPGAVRECLAYEQARVGTSGVAGLFRPALPTSSPDPFDRLLALLGRRPA